MGGLGILLVPLIFVLFAAGPWSLLLFAVLLLGLFTQAAEDSRPRRTAGRTAMVVLAAVMVAGVVIEPGSADNPRSSAEVTFRGIHHTVEQGQGCLKKVKIAAPYGVVRLQSDGCNLKEEVPRTYRGPVEVTMSNCDALGRCTDMVIRRR